MSSHRVLVLSELSSDGPAAIDAAVLVQRLVEGDPWAREMFYRSHVRSVTLLVARILRASDDVEDVVQDTFVDAFEQIDRLRDPARVQAWLRRIAVHKAYRRLRRQKLLGRLGLARPLDEPLTEQASPGLTDEQFDALRRLDEALGGLPAKEHTVWVLRHVEGYTLQEISEVTGQSLATVKRRLAAAQRVIRRKVEVNDD